MAETSKSGVKFSSNDDVDRLSPLPDDILCHILSFLDTKYAAATCILSTRWKNLCLALPDIVFDDSLKMIKWNYNVERDFENFALRHLMSRNVTHINRFRLKCNFSFRNPLILILLRSAIWHHVKELDICSPQQNVPQCYTARMIFPSDVFTSRWLVVFKLKGEFALDIPELVYLPNLKVLVLQDIKLVSDHHSLKGLFEGCRMLEDLLLSYHTSYSFKHAIVDISIPSLRKLSIRHTYDVSKFSIDTPNLEVFEYIGHPEKLEFVNELKFLDRAEILFAYRTERFFAHIAESYYLRPQDCKDLFDLINMMHAVKSLHLSWCILGALHSDYPLHEFEDLRSLKLDGFYLQALLSILASTPRLEELVINTLKEDYYGGVTNAEDSRSLSGAVPACLAKHLKNVEFKCFRDLQSEFVLAKYFLLNGKALKKMKFEIQKPRRTQDLSATYDRISMIRKCSKQCEIVFALESESDSD